MTHQVSEFSYKFSEKELRSLALVIRKNQDRIPVELFSFSAAVQNEIYRTLSIDEAERFYRNETV